MPECPKCHQRVQFEDVTCKYCRTELKAFGHPGIPLYRAEKDSFLCDSCTYHHDDTCNYPQRPLAKTCTMYQNYSDAQNNDLDLPVYYPTDGMAGIKIWCQRNPGKLGIIMVALVSFAIAFLR